MHCASQLAQLTLRPSPRCAMGLGRRVVGAADVARAVDSERAVSLSRACREPVSAHETKNRSFQPPCLTPYLPLTRGSSLWVNGEPEKNALRRAREQEVQ